MSSETVTSVTAEEEPRKAMFYVVSVNKLIYMTMLTTGLYILYWFYRNWATYRDATGERLIPLLRSIIPVIFVWPLLRRIDNRLMQSGCKYEWSPKFLSSSMWLILVVSVGASFVNPEPTEQLKTIANLHLLTLVLTVLQLLAVLWVLCQIQRVVNVVEDDPEGESNAHFSAANNCWIGLGIAIWMVYFISVALLFSLAY
ncbi:hypothetical protein CSV86_023405 [Pseudomonas putida CSV86]|uniref:Uncharacterized protein n=1 Tax=Pseudomonas bharatica CSV86 TaxID=1005395 RepID=L1M143_9PSED|nr:hypothetical protein [Pseudomonas bharatica]NNJ17913.1 hypothetical protein [Pseudomonas bharatica CSV86]